MSVHEQYRRKRQAAHDAVAQVHDVSIAQILLLTLYGYFDPETTGARAARGPLHWRCVAPGRAATLDRHAGEQLFGVAGADRAWPRAGRYRKNDVNYVVTEHGGAQLHGKSTRERVRVLIDFSYSDFRPNFDSRPCGWARLNRRA